MFQASKSGAAREKAARERERLRGGVGDGGGGGEGSSMPPRPRSNSEAGVTPRKERDMTPSALEWLRSGRQKSTPQGISRE